MLLGCSGQKLSNAKCKNRNPSGYFLQKSKINVLSISCHRFLSITPGKIRKPTSIHPGNHQKTVGFLMISGEIEVCFLVFLRVIEQWNEKGYKI